MKLFDFHCVKCDDTFEDLVEINEIPNCPNCGNKTEKVLSAPQAYFGNKTKFVNSFIDRHPGMEKYKD